MSAGVRESYAYCERVARSKAKNFYYSFVLLKREQRLAMCAIYAFMRECDDLSDEPGAGGRAGALEAWRADMVSALAGRDGDHPLWPAFRDTVSKFGIPTAYLHEMIDGVTSDLTARRVETFDELYKYCYQVASVVGLTIIHIFGFEDPEAIRLAEKCGVAFQITNILRDVREDAGRGRVYLPAEDLARFGVDASEFTGAGGGSERFRRLMEFEAKRARAYYDESAPLIGMVGKQSQRSLWALIEIYSRLLQRIEESDYDVLSRRIRLSSVEKIRVLLEAAAGNLRRRA